MNREQPHILVHALVHRAVELGELGEVGPDLVLLVSGFFEQALGDHEADVLPGQQHLGEAVLHTAQAVGDVLETVAIKDGFLHAGHEAKAQVLGDFADLAQEREVQHQIVILAGPQVIEKLVHHQQHAVVGVNLGEHGHHLLERRFVVDHLVGCRERVADTVLFKKELKLLCDDVPQRHLAGDLDAVNLELAGDLVRRFCNLGVPDHGLVGRVLGHKRQHRHQVRLTSAIVADHQHTHVVDGLVEGELRNHLLGDPLGHVVGHDVGRNELLGLIRSIGVEQLDDRFDWFELNQIAIFHLVRHDFFSSL